MSTETKSSSDGKSSGNVKSSSDVKVFARFRPLNDREEQYYVQHPKEVRKTYKYKDGYENTIEIVQPKRESITGEMIDQQLKVGDEAQTKDFTFDAIFDETTTQKQLYTQVAQPMVNDVLQGFNATIMAYGQTGCLAPETEVRMFDGTLKPAVDVNIGDVLMGDDSLPRNVLKLFSGTDDMYDIIPTNGDTYRVNKDHVLTLYYAVDSRVQWCAKENRFKVNF